MKRREKHTQIYSYTYKQAALLSERTEALMQTYPVAVWPMTQYNTHTHTHEVSVETEPDPGQMLKETLFVSFTFYGLYWK